MITIQSTDNGIVSYMLTDGLTYKINKSLGKYISYESKDLVDQSLTPGWSEILFDIRFIIKDQIHKFDS